MSSRRVLTASVVATIVIAGVIVAPPAQADPAATPGATNQTLVGFGSSLTETLLDRIASSVNTTAGTQKIASYGISGAPSLVVKPDGAELPRARNDIDAIEMLSLSFGRLGTGYVETTQDSVTITNPEAAGEVDFARTTLPPAVRGMDAGSSSGVWSYVPFAKESVALAVNPATVTNNGVNLLGPVLTIGSSLDTANTPSIYSIYHCLARFVYVSASNTYVGVGPSATPLPAGATRAVEIKPLLPTFDRTSDTRAYFVTALAGYASDSSSLLATNPSTSCIRTTTTTSGVNSAVTDANMGQSLAAVGTGAIGPYSVSSWISQSRSATTGVLDSRRGAILLGMKSGFATSLPVLFNGDANGGFPTARPVFNVVPYHRVSDPTTRDYAVFNGAGSDLCANSALIRQFGFATLTNSTTPASLSDCGFIGYRAGGKYSPPVDFSLEFSQVAWGDAVDMTVKTNQMAGVATFYETNPDGSTKIPDSEMNIGSYDFVATRTSLFTPQSSTPGDTFSFRAIFQATDTNMFAGPTWSPIRSFRLARPYSVTMSDIPDRVRSGTAVPITATISPGDGGQLVGGTIKLVSPDGVVFASARVPRRATSVDFDWVPSGSGSRSMKVVFDPENSSPSLSAETAVQDVDVASYTPSMRVAPVQGFEYGYSNGYVGSVSTSSSTVPTLALTLSSAGGTPSGTVSVLISSSPSGGTWLTLYPIKVAADGTARVRLPLASKWRVTGTSGGVTRYLRVVYSGDSLNYSSSQSLKVLIKN